MTTIRMFLAIAVLAAAGLWGALAHAQASNFLVDTDWVEKNLTNPKVRIVEVSVDPGLYERGHIPGAVNLRWHSDLVDPVKRDIATKEKFQKLLRTAGIAPDTTTILYGDNNNWFAAWGAWIFDIYGVQNVKLLDGGRKKWEAEKRPLSPLTKAYPASTLTVKDPNTQLRAKLADVVAVAEKKVQGTLLDIRSPDEYNGKIIAPPGLPELAIRAGHVPGAVNVPWAQAVAPDGTFKPVEELRKLYAVAGVDAAAPDSEEGK